MQTLQLLFSFIALLHCSMNPVRSSTFTLTNNCSQTIWPGTLAGAGMPQLPSTGFQLDSGCSVRLPAPSRWSGRIWARTGCNFSTSGSGACETGDCSGRIKCDGVGGKPPTTLFEITLGEGSQEDYYDVSLVDGYNLPVLASPRAEQGACNATGCISDLNLDCPKELQVCDDVSETRVVACKSACDAFGLDEYCCSREFANPDTCKPSSYSEFFKDACPKAYSYAFDDRTSTFTCKAVDYTIVFCPSTDNEWRNRSNGFSNNQSRQPQENSIKGKHPQLTIISRGTADSLSFQVLGLVFCIILFSKI